MSILNLKNPARILTLACFLLFAGSASARVEIVPKWGLFEKSFKSQVNYANAIQQCTLKVIFISPLRETNEVYGFWDGGKMWRVRFSPDQPGQWTYRTVCDDPANHRLNNQTGEFVCTSPVGQARFAQHGPVHVAKDHRHFEHADGSPFFWLADVAWNAPRLATQRDWVTYTQVRGGQNFSAVQLAAMAGTDLNGHSPFSGQSRIVIDPRYFQNLDEKIDMANRAGLLSVIAPLWGNGGVDDLPEDQLTLLVRYLNARWGAYDVAWLLAVKDDHGARWLRIGRDVFGSTAHGPVIISRGELASAFDEFRNESWVDAFGFGLGQNMNSDSIEWLVSGPLHREATAEMARPLINVYPPLENGLAAQGQTRLTANDVRRVAWWSLLLAPAAGVSYGAQDVATWNAVKQSKLPTWQLSLFLPGAKQMAHIAQFVNSTDCSGLRPAPRTVANQPGRNAPQRYVAVAEDEAKNLGLAYIPEDRTLELNFDALPASPTIQWLNPRTGQKSPAVAVVGTRTCQFPTPDAGDWVLVMKHGK